MKDAELRAYEKTHYLNEGHAFLLQKIRPFFSKMIEELILLPEGSSADQIMKPFEKCLNKLNQYENEIETVERETLLGAIYEISAIVGLDPVSGFSEEWRGDW
jgi:hypothetical protein